MTLQEEDITDIEKAIISLIAYSRNGRLDGDTRIQKLGFMFSKTSGDSNLDDEFSYMPHNFGPYSEEVEYGLKQLKQYGLINITGKPVKYSLTIEGNKLFKPMEKNKDVIVLHAKEILSQIDHLDTNELISVIYELYPTFTKNSIIVNKIKNCNASDSIHIPINKLQNGTEFTIKSRCGINVNVEFNNNKIIIKSD